MARLAISAVGAIGFGAFGLPPSLGWALGSFVGGALFGEESDAQQRTSLRDFQGASGDYGTPIPVPYGTIRMPGTLIWYGNEEVITIEGSSSQSSKSTVTTLFAEGGTRTGTTSGQDEQHRFMDVAWLVSAREIDDVLAVYLDKSLAFDKRSPTSIPPGRRPKLYVMTGAEDQLPREGMETEEGDGNVPGYRGYGILFIKDLNVTVYGERIPFMEAVVTVAKTDTYPYETIDTVTEAEGSALTDVSGDELDWAWDTTRDVLVALDGGSDRDASGIRIIDRTSRTEINSATLAEIDGDSSLEAINPPMVVDNVTGAIYLKAGGLSNSEAIARIDGYTLRETAKFGASSNSISSSPTNITLATTMAVTYAPTATGVTSFLLVGTVFSHWGIYTGDALVYIADGAVDEARIPRIIPVTTPLTLGLGYAYIIGGPSSGVGDLGVYRVELTAAAAYDTDAAATTGMLVTKVGTISSSNWGGSAGTLAGGFHDPNDDTLVLLHEAGYVLKYDPSDGSIVWTAGPFAAGAIPSFPHGQHVEGLLYYDVFGWHAGALGNTAWSIDLADGTMIWDGVDVSGTKFGSASGGLNFWDARDESLIAYTSDNGLQREWFHRGTGEGESLRSVLADLCDRAGYDAADYDVSGIDANKTVRGYALTRQATPAAAIEQLQAAYFFDTFESDHQIKFVDRGGAAVTTLTASDLVVPKNDALGSEPGAADAFDIERIDREQIPRRIWLTYPDIDSDYQVNDLPSKRVIGPVETVEARSEESVELPIVFTADEALAIVERLMYGAQVEIETYKATLSWRWQQLDPSDIVNVTFDGRTYRARLTSTSFGANMEFEILGVADDADVYEGSGAASTRGGVTVQTLASAGKSRIIPLDIPLLLASHDTGHNGLRHYVFMAPFAETNWPGAGGFRSPDGQIWTQRGSTRTAGAWGSVRGTIPDAVGFSADVDSTITIVAISGGSRLSTASRAQITAGANAFAFLKTNGEVEIIQARDVADNGDGTYTLSHLWRGIRGTDAYWSGYAGNETWCLLESGPLFTDVMPQADLGVTRFWRAVTFGTTLSDSYTQSLALTGRDQKPWAPVHVLRTDDANTSGDMQIEWTRRTRFNGRLFGATIGDVPLNETSESYEVDILDGDGGNVVRTLSASTTQVLYSDAQIAADFGTAPATLYVVVYQLSAEIGRGFGRQWALVDGARSTT